MKKKKETDGYRLEIPLDASGIEGFKAEKGIRVLLIDASGRQFSQAVQLKQNGKESVVFDFDEPPGAIKAFIGPEDATDEQLQGMQTLQTNISTRQWKNENRLVLSPVVIPPYYWWWWLRWCRQFTITGRVICPDGSPVPGAKVCAKDVDFFWWWSSVQQIGCATTDETGSFELTFRWCCGWWPWWWWRFRSWRLEPVLVDRILPELRRLPRIKKIPLPDPQPDLSIFSEMLPEEESVSRALAPGRTLALSNVLAAPADRSGDFNLSSLGRLQGELQRFLPKPEIGVIDRFKIWPWWPWQPWWDCAPDVIFQVTQNCGDEEVIIVDETVWDTRWNIPTSLNVTLVANSLACCIDDTPDPEGNCLNLTHACDVPIDDIGGNFSSPKAFPEGYAYPGVHSYGGDRPFAGNISIWGDFGTLAGADYYELEWREGPLASWKSMPPGAIAGFTRRYYGPQLPAGAVAVWPVPFSVQNIDGRQVIESRQHFEANNGAGTWHVLGSGSRWWTHHRSLLATWRTQDFFTDGSYELRVKAWQLSGGHLINPVILEQCGTSPASGNQLILSVDNRFEGSGPNDPNGHPCGAGTVHKCTAEPDVAILSVKIIHADNTETPVAACGERTINSTDKLRIDFAAHDPDGHLSYFTLNNTYGNSLIRNLLNQSSSVLSTTGVAPTSWAPVAAQVGPYYAHSNAARSALDQGAASPVWHGGVMRLELNAMEAFPVTCCYQLELRAHKRTIVNCDKSLWGHINYAEYSFMIVVGGS